MNGSAPQWPRRFPGYTFVGLCGAAMVSAGALKVWSMFRPVQMFYLRDYVATGIHAGAKAQEFAVRIAPGQVVKISMLPAGFHAWMARGVYDGQPLNEVLFWPMVVAGIAVLAALIWGGIMDARYNRTCRIGRLVRGPELVTEAQFNRAVKGDGLAIQSGINSVIRIPKDREAHHIQIAGDTGSGKSSVVRSILYQVEGRGETAIIFDPDREYIKEFFNAERGDWVLNPKDERCPYWPIGEEAADEAEATPIAVGLFPDGPTVQKFFLNHTRNLFAYLLATYRPTVTELCHWMAHPEEIDSRVQGTEHQHTMADTSPNQRGGLIGSFNEAGKPLRMMPGADDGRRVLLIREWAEKRQGWIFITSTPDTLDALRPLQSLWLDLLILKLQNGVTNPRRVWMILDEVAALNQLPQLHAALTRQRKSNNPMVLGFQGMAQIEYLYGDKMAQTILSQSFTNIILRTRESKAAHHLSELIGKQEIERLRESRPAALLSIKGRSYSTEKIVTPVVLEGEIQGLDDCTGYFLQLDKVVKISFLPLPKRERAPGLIKRTIPTVRPNIVAMSTPVKLGEPAKKRRLKPFRCESEPGPEMVSAGLFG